MNSEYQTPIQTLITSATRLGVFSEIDVNNGCILLNAGVALELAVTYLALVKKKLLQIVQLIDKCTYKVIKRGDVILFANVTSHAVPNLFDGIHIGAPARPLKILNPLLCKRICNNTCPMRMDIVVLKYGACCLMCLEMWIHNRLKDIVNVTLPCQSLSNNLEIKLVVMAKAVPHHNGSATEHFSFSKDVILKWILSTSSPYPNTPIRKALQKTALI